MTSGSLPIPDVIDAGVSACPHCTAPQGESRTTWWRCDGCAHLFPAASWLFEGYHPASHNRFPEFDTPREGFTTALFALYLLQPDGDKSFPVRIVESRDQCRVSGQLDLGGLQFHQLGIELHGRPDLIIRQGDRVLHIENKLLAPGGRGSVNAEGQILRYRREAKESGAHFYVLISCGNPQPALWNVLAKEKVLILLWEEVFLRMDQANFAVQLAPTGTLKPYYETYLRPA